MQILGMDVATSTGLCWMDTTLPSSKWRCLALQSEGENIWDVVQDFNATLQDLLTEQRPDFAVIERPIEVIVDHGPATAAPQYDRKTGKPKKRMINATTTITLSALAGNAIGVLNGLGIPYGLIAIRSWRAAYYGKGAIAPNDDWKEIAVQWAEHQQIPLPSTKKAKMDAAEAIGIASSWSRCTFIPAHHQRAFMDLRIGKVAA